MYHTALYYTVLCRHMEPWGYTDQHKNIHELGNLVESTIVAEPYAISRSWQTRNPCKLPKPETLQPQTLIRLNPKAQHPKPNMPVIDSISVQQRPSETRKFLEGTRAFEACSLVLRVGYGGLGFIGFRVAKGCGFGIVGFWAVVSGCSALRRPVSHESNYSLL